MIAQIPNVPGWIYLVVSVIGGLGGMALLFSSLRKSGPEATKVVIDAAGGAVIVQAGVIESLRDELTRQAERFSNAIAELKHENEKHIAALRAERDRYKLALEQEQAERAADRKEWTERIQHLEDELARLQESAKQ